VISLCLGFSALYELFEWAVAVITRDSAENFLGTQGYIWDTQSDMAMALAGAILALLVLSSEATGSVLRYWLFAFPVWYVFARYLQPRPVATIVLFSFLSLVNGAYTCAWLYQKISAI